MTLKLKFPKFLRSTKSKDIEANPSVNYANVLYIESLILLFEKIDDGTTEMLRKKVDDYLAQYDNNYEEAKKHLFADFETQLNMREKVADYLMQYDNNYEEAKKHFFADFDTQVNTSIEASSKLSQSF